MPIDDSPNTIFSLGYWGWGNHAEKLVELIDQSERRLGFKCPIFVDIRSRRAVRAVDFQGNNFANVVGKRRYQHFPLLGNARIGTKDQGIKIADPDAARDLFHLVQAMKKERRRVLYFCACKEPIWCHRHIVSKLLVAEAIRDRQSTKCVEWPGGSPEFHEMHVDKDTMDRACRGQSTIRLPRAYSHLRVLPWYSVVRLRHKDRSLDVFTGRAGYKDGWSLPYYEDVEYSSRKDLLLDGKLRWHDWGYAPLSTR